MRVDPRHREYIHIFVYNIIATVDAERIFFPGAPGGRGGGGGGAEGSSESVGVQFRVDGRSVPSQWPFNGRSESMAAQARPQPPEAAHSDGRAAGPEATRLTPRRCYLLYDLFVIHDLFNICNND